MNISVIGLGYVGLPLALNLAKSFDKVVGFDINSKKVDAFKNGIDAISEGLEGELKNTKLIMTSNKDELKGTDFYIVCVPTPIDADKRPDLTPLDGACQTISDHLKKGDIVVFESTVYPGLTEDYCGALLEKLTGLKKYEDFKLGYSPERMNPGDKERSVDKIVKVISAQDKETLRVVKEVYSKVVKVGVYEAESIKVAEAAKVIENTQRDINIALMNECALIFDKMGISTKAVLNAASTKWNFLKFSPGLVGGHCIGVDPYYLTAKAESLGYHPEVILAGRRINDNMGKFIANKTIKLLIKNDVTIRDAKIGIFGLTFKENVADLRNSRVPDIYNELKEFGINPLVCDPFASKELAKKEYDIDLVNFDDFKNLDAIVLAVAHSDYIETIYEKMPNMLKNNGVIVDVKTAFMNFRDSKNYTYWAL
ncbi:MAG: nucleotide sugar dehydrogenase [Bdellovibrionota bacterium]|nr:nucleotide sugar dehydrogenase [Pseudomonadota bacterium]MDY6090758.1 nucleotide sugar dehydrogenase [Bdellovibrionota bacterium]